MIETKLKFADSFFREEEKCGFYVTKKRKEVWAIELDMLREFDQVCRKHNLKYYLHAGTLLGAVRHKGFIPWDDDIDVAMLRADYNNLLKIAPDEFRYPYFFQHAYTDISYHRGHAQLRNSKTCGALHYELLKVKFNQGIFIDIFPLDAVSDEPQNLTQQERELQQYIQLMNRMEQSAVPKPIALKMPNGTNFRFENLQHIYSLYDACVARYENAPAKYVASISFLGKINKNIFLEREWLGEPTYLQFECLTLPAPSNADAIMRKYYGEDYMTPVNKAPVHETVLFDTDRSYLEVISGMRL